MKIGDKLRTIRKQQGLTQKQLAQKAGVVQSTISDIETSNRVVNLNQMEKICAALQIPMYEILDDNDTSGDERTVVPPPEYGLLSEKHRHIIDALIQELSLFSVKKAAILSDDDRIPSTFFNHIIGNAAAGRPLSDEAFPDEMVELPAKYADTERFYLIRARGDSMEPRIRSGDIVIVQVDAEPQNGQIALIRLAGLADDEYTIKRFYREKDHIVLRSFNSNYPDMAYDLKEIRACETVVDILKKGV